MAFLAPFFGFVARAAFSGLRQLPGAIVSGIGHGFSALGRGAIGIGRGIGYGLSGLGGSSSGGGSSSSVAYRGNSRLIVTKRFAQFERAMDNAVQRALKSVAEECAADARRRAPVRTGKLRDSIEVGPLQRTSRGYKIEVVATAPYALYVERGSKHNPKPAHYLRRAARGGKKRLIEAMRAEIR